VVEQNSREPTSLKCFVCLPGVRGFQNDWGSCRRNLLPLTGGGWGEPLIGKRSVWSEHGRTHGATVGCRVGNAEKGKEGKEADENRVESRKKKEGDRERIG